MSSFAVPGNPIPWQRAGNRGIGHFTPKRTRDYQKRIKDTALASGVRSTAQFVKVTLRFYRETAHPCDVDNLVKTYLDALQGVAFDNDRQVVCLFAEKFVDRENPRAEVEVEETMRRTSAAAENTLEGLKRIGSPKPRPRLVSSVRRPG